MIATIKDTLTTASIDSSGAQLISLKDTKGKEYIWQRDPSAWANCSPLLFPIVGNCRNNKTVIEGREYEIMKHGFCKETDFTVTEQSETSVTFQIQDSEKTRNVYPYAFRLSLTYSLEDGALSMDYKVENTDQKTIYYCIGAHPGFICPMEEGAEFTDYTLEFEKEETADSMVYDLKNLQFNPENLVRRLDHSRTLPLNYELFKDDAVYFYKLKSRKVSLIHASTRRGIEVSYPDFETVAFWTPYETKAPFLCIEPWNGSGVYATEDDEYTHKHDIQKLPVHTSKSYHLGIKIL